MKKTFFLVLLSAFYLAGFTQNDSLPEAPYKRFPTPPPFKLLLPDSVTYFTKDDLSKKKAIMIMLFSPDCEHCQHKTEEIIKHINTFEKVQIVMSTTLPFDKMLAYYTKYDLKRFNNIIMGRDISYLLPAFYNIRNLPFLAFYDKKKKLISEFEGALPIEKVIEEIGK
jgi:thioredoxin-related protein